MQVAELQSQVAELKFDRSKWKPVRFDQLAQNITDRVDNPAEAGVDRYVGLEHLDPHSLKLARWGSPTDVEATKLRFQPGDIIFGKRRAYQRKLAVADFEGICSAHAMVLRAREETVSLDYLPVFMQSEYFFETALKISVGGLSPTINWRELARQEFRLPPMDDQRRIADMLWAAEKTVEAYGGAMSTTRKATTAVFSDLGSKSTMRPLGALCSIRSGTTPRRTEKRFWAPEFPWLTTSQVNDRIITTPNEFVSSVALKECSLPICPPDSVLVALYGEGRTRGMAAYLTIEATINQAFACLTPNGEVLPMFLFLALESCYEDLRHASQGSNQKNLSGSILGEFKIPVPDPSVQRQIVLEVERLIQLEENCLRRSEETRSLQGSLSASIWGNSL